MTSPYHIEYDGYYAMVGHDRQENALRRWFENYKLRSSDVFAGEYEWLVVTEVDAVCKHRRKRFVCEIGIDRDGPISVRKVVMDHTAPPAPMLTFAAKRRWMPPPPKSAEEQRREFEWNRMRSLGYELRHVARRVRSGLPSVMDFDVSEGLTMAKLELERAMTQATQIEYVEEWVKIDPSRWRRVGIDLGREVEWKPPPPSHRRNV